MTILCTDKHTTHINIVDYTDPSQGVGRMVPIAMARAAPELVDLLERLALTYAHYRKEKEPDWNPETNSRSLKEIKTLLTSLKEATHA